MSDKTDIDPKPVEEINAQHKRLWRDWIVILCKCEGHAIPNEKEWDALSTDWTPDSAPTDSVAQLKIMRKKENKL